MSGSGMSTKAERGEPFEKIDSVLRARSPPSRRLFTALWTSELDCILFLSSVFHIVTNTHCCTCTVGHWHPKSESKESQPLMEAKAVQPGDRGHHAVCIKTQSGPHWTWDITRKEHWPRGRSGIHVAGDRRPHSTIPSDSQNIGSRRL